MRTPLDRVAFVNVVVEFPDNGLSAPVVPITLRISTSISAQISLPECQPKGRAIKVQLVVSSIFKLIQNCFDLCPVFFV